MIIVFSVANLQVPMKARCVTWGGLIYISLVVSFRPPRHQCNSIIFFLFAFLIFHICILISFFCGK